MPKLLHEVVTHILRAAPETLVRLLPPDLALAFPATARPRVTAAELPDLQLLEFRADTVLLFGDDGRPSAVIIGEVQNDFDKRKLFTIPAYLALARAKFECPALIVIVALDPDVAAAYRRPIELGFGRGYVSPVVISAADVPQITDLELARACPQLAVLSAVVHGHAPGAEYIALTALTVTRGLDSEAQLFYPDAIFSRLGEAAHLALEQLMRSDSTHPYHSEFARRYYDQGSAEGEVRILFKLLSFKGFTLSPSLHARVTACRDLEQIEAWIDRVLTARTIDDVFSEE